MPDPTVFDAWNFLVEAILALGLGSQTVVYPASPFTRWFEEGARRERTRRGLQTLRRFGGIPHASFPDGSGFVS